MARDHISASDITKIIVLVGRTRWTGNGAASIAAGPLPIVTRSRIHCRDQLKGIERLPECVWSGLYKTKDGWANEDSVRVRYDDGKELDVPASQYEADGYKPPIDELPYA